MQPVHLSRIRRLRYLLFCALGLVMPTLEAPKTLIIVLLAATVLAEFLIRQRQMLSRPDVIEWALLALVAAAAISTFANWPLASGVKGLKDIAVQSFVLWALYRERYSAAEHIGIAKAIVLGVIIGLFEAFVQTLTGWNPAFEFRSAGVVTQSAVYLAMTILLSIGLVWLADYPRKFAFDSKPIWIAGVVFFAVCLMLMASRGAVLAMLVALVILGLLIRTRRFVIGMLVLLGLSAAIGFSLPDTFAQHRFVQKIEVFFHTGQLDYSDILRRDMWRVGIAQATQGDSWLLGVGPRSFKHIDTNRLQMNPPLPKEHKALLDHPHNLFLTKLVEEGILGLAAFLFFLGLMGQLLVRDWKQDRWRTWQWISAFGALVIPVVAGSFNSPWINEPAILSMLLFAIYASSRRDGLPHQGEGQDGDGSYFEHEKVVAER